MLKPMENNYREVKSLDGLWAFWVDFAGEGYQKGYFRGLPPDEVQPITVPSSYNDIFSDPRIKNHIGDVWYQRQVLVPRSYSNRRVVLRFGSVSHKATVWIDGFEVAHHYGGFTPFEIDITHLVHAGDKFTIVVCCNNDLYLESSKLGLEADDDPAMAKSDNNNLAHVSSASSAPLSPFPNSFTFAGIQRSVQLIYTPYQFIDDLTVVSDVSPDLKKARVNVSLIARDMAGSNLNSLQLSPLMRRRLEIKKYELERQRYMLTSFNLTLSDIKGRVVARGVSAVTQVQKCDCRNCFKRHYCVRSPFRKEQDGEFDFEQPRDSTEVKGIDPSSKRSLNEYLEDNGIVSESDSGVCIGGTLDPEDFILNQEPQACGPAKSSDYAAVSAVQDDLALSGGSRTTKARASTDYRSRFRRNSNNFASYSGYADGESGTSRFYEQCVPSDEEEEEAILETGVDDELSPETMGWDWQGSGDLDQIDSSFRAHYAQEHGAAAQAMPRRRVPTAAVPHNAHVSLEGVKYKGQVTLEVVDPTLWQPGYSYLYFLQVQLKSGDAVIDEYTLRVGIRSIEIRGQQLLINHKPFYFKGMARTEDSELRGQAFDYVTMIHDQSLMALLGANAYRTAHSPFSEEQMDYADLKGIVVIDETPALCWYRPELINERVQLAHKRTMAELINRDKNHPCVVMWSIATEPEQAISNKNSQDGADGLMIRQYLEPIVSYARRLDSSRPLTLVNLRDAKSNAAIVDLFDVLSVKFSDTELCKQIPAQDLAQLYEFLRQDLKPWLAYHKPVIVSEYGVDTLAGFYSESAERGSEEYQIKWLELCHHIFGENDAVVGEFLTFADINPVLGVRRDSRKGIFTRDRHPKSAVFTLTKHFLSC